MKNDLKIAVIGLGYVGLPLARLFSTKYKTVGYDLSQPRVDALMTGHDDTLEVDDYLLQQAIKDGLICTTNLDLLKDCNVYVVAVPTPVDINNRPDLLPLIKSSTTVAKVISKGDIVIYESTVYPGVTEEECIPIIEEVSGLKFNVDFYAGYSPERINPGDPKWNVTNINRVVGAFDKKGLQWAADFYENIVDGQIMQMSSIREAEAVKIVENSFRDINIAFVNELAKSFDKMGIDVVEAIKGAATKPFSFMPHWPSCGVGGHCIPVDPYYLIERAKLSGFDHEFMKIARKVNLSMPEYTIELLQDALNEVKMPLNGTTVGVLGLSYKANVSDLRESPVKELIKLLKENKANVLTFDPYVTDKSTVKNLSELFKKSDAILLATDHTEFKKISSEDLKKNGIKVVIDGKNCLDKESIKESGMVYKGIGRR